MDADAALELGTSLFDLQLFVLGGTPVTTATVVVLAIMLLLVWWLSRLASRGVAAGLRRRGVGDDGNVRAIARLTHYLILSLGVGVALQTAGFDLGALFAASAVFAVGLGFALQNLAENFVSGVLLLLERSITPGDILEVEGRVVRVVAMRFRTTVARTRDEEDLIIPNATLVQSTVKNFTLKDSEFRLRVTLGVSYRSDMALVRRVLQEVAASMPFSLPSHPPRVQLMAFGASTVDWEVNVWTNDPWASRQQTAALNEAIWYAFLREGIQFAYPQVEIHLATEAADVLARGRVGAAPAEGGSSGQP